MKALSRKCPYSYRKKGKFTMKTLYVSDLDGTLLLPNVTLSNMTVRILNDLIKEGIHFSVATARSIASVKHILKDVNINIPIILMNGACIYDLESSKYIKVNVFPEDSKKLLLNIIDEHKLMGFAYTINDHKLSTYYEDISLKSLYNFYNERVNKYNKPFTKLNKFSCLKDEPLVYFSLIDTKENLEPIYNVLLNMNQLGHAFYKDNYAEDIWYLEIYSTEASKFNAIQYIRKLYKYDKVVCFGDNRNDLPMFQASDLKIAVENAFPELKSKADIIVASNKDDGVALWLKNNITHI